MKYLLSFTLFEGKYYKENPKSTFTHDGQEYDLNKLLKLTHGEKGNNFPIKELKWILKHTKVTKSRVEKADISYPILIGKMDNKWVVYDGVHRLTKAIEEDKTNIKAIKVSNYLLNKCKIKNINESKQVGVLYHYTDVGSILDIIEDDSLNSEGGTISFTRDSRMHDTTVMDGVQGGSCRLVLNGDMLSYKYKVRPYNFYYPDLKSARPTFKSSMEVTDDNTLYSGTESEEAIMTDSIKDIKRYLIRVDFIYGSKNKWYNEEPSQKVLDILTKNNIPYKLIH